MAVTRTTISGDQIPATLTVLATGDANGDPVIEAFDVFNTDASNSVTLTVRIVDSGGTNTDAKWVRRTITIAPNGKYLGDGIVGQSLKGGATLEAVAGTANDLSFRGVIATFY